jgi:hypothetical protein
MPIAAPMHVRKADGTVEPFRESKLRSSLTRSGASSSTINEVIREIAPAVERGVSTDAIYKKALALLKHDEPSIASRYSLKRAVFDLGPTGFPFEDFISELLKGVGYETAIRQTIQGKCVAHEVDLIAYKDGQRIGAEIKFHNSPGIKTDLKTALYVHARFQDIEAAPASHDGEANHLHERWLLTNTKFTTQAIAFAQCAGLTLVGWSYPKKGNLQHLVEAAGRHPITCLTTLSNVQKQQLINKGHVLCRSIGDQPEVLREVGVGRAKISRVLSEVYDLCGS